MKATYKVLFEDGAIETVQAHDISEAWEKALDIKNETSIVDVWME